MSANQITPACPAFFLPFYLQISKLKSILCSHLDTTALGITAL